MRQHLRQLVWLHASGPLAAPPGPGALQRPGLRLPQEVQRPGADLMKLSFKRGNTRLVAFRTDNGTVHRGLT